MNRHGANYKQGFLALIDDHEVMRRKAAAPTDVDKKAILCRLCEGGDWRYLGLLCEIHFSSF